MPVSLPLPALLGGPAVRPTGPPAWPGVDADVQTALAQCVQSGDWGRYAGRYGRTLAERLAELHAVEHVLLCSSGTAAVELALRGLNIGPGDEVLLAAYDFKGNFLNVVTVGATPVLVDIDPQTGQLAVPQAAAAVTPRTRAILASHLHGGVVDLAALRRLAEPQGIAIIEDACQTPGAPLGDKVAGSHGDVGVISFGGSKLLSAGRGGALLTNRADVVVRVRRYGFRGNDAYPLSELQAAVLPPQLQRLAARRQERRRRAQELCARLAEFRGLTPLPPASPPDEPDYYKVAFRYDPHPCGGLSRELFAAALRAEGVALYPGFRALHQIHARSRFRQWGDLCEATRADAEWLVLHHPVLLAGAAAVDEVVDAVRKTLHHADRLRAAGLRVDAPVSPWEVET